MKNLLIVLSLSSLNLIASSDKLTSFYNSFNKAGCMAISSGVKIMDSHPENFFEELVLEGEHREGDDMYFQIFTEKDEVLEQLISTFKSCLKPAKALKALKVLKHSDQLFAAFLGDFYIENGESTQDYAIMMSSGEYLKLHFSN